MAECIISGRQGPKGDTGAQGPQGATGSTGSRGPAGAGVTCRRLTATENITVPGRSFRFVAMCTDNYCYTRNMEMLVNTNTTSQSYSLGSKYVVSDAIYF